MATGGSDTRERLLEAASALLAERPPSAITTRDIAERAGVQHSLIHRHFGTKDQLVREVVLRVAVGYWQAIADEDDPLVAFANAFAYLVEHKSAIQAFASAVVVDEIDADREKEGFPAVAQHVAQLASLDTGDIDRRVIATAAIAMMGGWSMLEDWAMQAGNLDDLGRDEVRRQVGELLRTMVTGVRRADTPL